MQRPSLGIVVPALEAEATIAATLRALKSDIFTVDLLVVDGGSSDATASVARDAGARVMEAPRGRGIQLAAGAREARGDALLFVHADTVLEAGWDAALLALFGQDKAAYFRFALDDARAAARRLERLVAWRCRRLALPYGDQALFIPRNLYESVGGFRPLPLMEDVDLVRRIGAKRLVALGIAARTSAARWRRDGYVRRSLRNATCLALYFLGMSPERLARLYS